MLLTLCVSGGEHADVTIRGADMLKVCRQLQLMVEYMNVGGCVQKYTRGHLWECGCSHCSGKCACVGMHTNNGSYDGVSEGSESTCGLEGAPKDMCAVETMHVCV